MVVLVHKNATHNSFETINVSKESLKCFLFIFLMFYRNEVRIGEIEYSFAPIHLAILNYLRTNHPFHFISFHFIPFSLSLPHLLSLFLSLSFSLLSPTRFLSLSPSLLVSPSTLRVTPILTQLSSLRFCSRRFTYRCQSYL